MVDRVLISGLFWFQWIWLKARVLVHPHSDLMCDGVFSQKTQPVRNKNHEFLLCSNIPLVQIQLNCYWLQEPLQTAASWPFYDFGGYPKSLKWSSQSRPMTDLVRQARPKRSRQSSLFLSLHSSNRRYTKNSLLQDNYDGVVNQWFNLWNCFA